MKHDSTTASASHSSLQQTDARFHLHPFSNATRLNNKGARVITHADGVYIWDDQGNKILDGMAGLWCVNLGYGREELAAVAEQQMRTLPYYNTFFQTTHGPVAQLAEAIASVTPGDLNRIFFASSGSEAIDTLMRLTRHYWAIKGKPWRNILISRDNAYHGSTIGGTSLGGMSGMHQQGGPLVPNIERIRQPYWYGEGGDQSEEAFGLTAARALEEKILAVGPDNVAAFVAEPIQGAGGVIVPPASYWPEIQRICRQYDILLAVDEVICGFGRTGNWFGSNTFNIQPDIISMAKGLSSGYLPIAAVAVGDRISNALMEHDNDFNHGFTYSGHPVAAAVALKTIEIMKTEGIVEQVRDSTGPYFQKALRESLADHPLVGQIDGVGLVAGIALVQDKATKTLFPSSLDIGMICRDHCFANGLIMRAVGSRMVLSPPLIISKTEINELCQKIRTCLDLTLTSAQQAGAL
ncbi:aspartate aminotransferase family protein [Oceanobacter sp. 3_MG-2023]|uniref:aspartate aminotransferase family protein n=1 Tax=Oceanobacter sp. 3_MG-2023 TaxID=3062622 RepID=UPI00273295FE|nr:aspartate aminotransferase family protein [Oceanobacter sp. 3_MG-2023]MDP2505812.1 aspartate aminotransferase family protein [Oceanobacter sp. 3_MG-2023]